MIEIQVKDFCFTCNGKGSTPTELICEACKGEGEVFNWITLEALSEIVADIQFRKTAKFNFPENEPNVFNNSHAIEEIQINPNPNI
jgi:RecJ-like exonuclease